MCLYQAGVNGLADLAQMAGGPSRARHLLLNLLLTALQSAMRVTPNSCPHNSWFQVVADAVRSDPFTFNEGFLGKAVEVYCDWIQQPDKWGGAIELFILAQHYK